MLQSLGGLLNGDGRAAQIVLAVVVLAVLIGLLYVLYRLLFAHRLRAPSGTRARGSRLGIVDVYGLDGQRQLVIVRRDNVEHLLMIGGPNDIVVEGNIVRATTNGAVRDPAKPAAAAPPSQSEPAAELPPAPYPRPVAPSAVSSVMKRAFSQRMEPSLAPAAEPAAVRSEEAVVPEARAKLEPARQPPEPARAGNNTVIPLPRAPADTAPAPKPANESKAAPTPVETPPAAKAAPEPPPRRAPPPPKAPEPAPRPALPSPIAPMRPRPAPAADTARPNPPPPPAEPPPKPSAPPEAVAPPPVVPAPVSTVAAEAASADKPAQRKEEAFYDLESLEAEMARLLGRDG